MLEQWESRLAADADALGAALRSGALLSATESLAQSSSHRLTLAGDSGVRELLLRLLARASAMPEEHLSGLLSLLTDAHAALERCLEAGESDEASESAVRTVQWASALLAAALPSWQEAGVLREAALARAAAAALSEEAPAAPAASSAAGAEEWFECTEARARRCRELRALLGARGPRHVAGCVASAGGAGGASALAGTAEALRAMREERERHVQSLGEEVARCANEEHGCQTQMRTSSDTYRSELEALRRRQQEATALIEDLSQERLRLQQKLAEIQEKIVSAQAQAKELKVNEKRLRGNMKRLSMEFCQQISSQGLRQEHLADERRAILETRGAAQAVEEQVAARAAALEAAAGEMEAAGDVGGLVAAGYALCEQRRLEALEELSASWNGLIWGHGANAQPEADAEHLAALRPALCRAAGLVDAAMTELPPEAALLAAGPAEAQPARAKAASQLADISARYQALRHQLGASLERLERQQGAPPAAEPGSGAAAGVAAHGPARHGQADASADAGAAPVFGGAAEPGRPLAAAPVPAAPAAPAAPAGAPARAHVEDEVAADDAE